jgi:MFS family permease
MFSLVIAMGVGRFAFTPLLPIMQREFVFGDDMAGVLASINYLGYLLGAIAGRYAAVARKRTLLFRVSLIANIATTAVMGLTSSLFAWWVFRFLAGVSSAGVFVLSSTIILDSLADNDRVDLSGYVYSGVGVGIALTGLLVPPFDSLFGVQGAWLGLAIFCLPMAYASWQWIVDKGLRQAADPAIFTNSSVPNEAFLKWLTAAYFCEGLGYIVSGTFLVSAVQRLTNSSSFGNVSWVLVGLAAAISTTIWPYIARRAGFVRVLIGTYLLQSIGIILPVVSRDAIFSYLGALLFGGTFMGITALSLMLGKMLQPQKSGRIIGTLTVVYGTGQIIGPLLAGILAARENSFVIPLVASSFIVAIGAALLAAGWCVVHNRYGSLNL